MRTERIVEIINDNGIKAEINKANKNGVILDGITLGEGTIRPTIYPVDFSGTDEEIATKIIEKYKSLDPTPQEFANIGDVIKDYDNIKDKIVACVMKATNADIVQTPILDLNIYYRIMVNSEASIKITNELLDMWGITKEELHNKAMQNIADDMIAVDIMSMLSGFDSDFFESDENYPMVVITNVRKTNGAIAMFTDIVGKVADKYESDVYILPSSIHECIVVPVDDMSANALASMISEVNDTQVDETEQLNNHPYLYRRNTGVVEFA